MFSSANVGILASKPIQGPGGNSPPGIPSGTLDITELNWTITASPSAIQWDTNVDPRQPFPYPIETGANTFFNGNFTNPATNPVLQYSLPASELSPYVGQNCRIWIYINCTTGNDSNWRAGYGSPPISTINSSQLVSTTVTIQAFSTLFVNTAQTASGGGQVAASPLPFIGYPYIGLEVL